MNTRKIIALVLSPLVIFGIFFPGKLANTFLYFKNGSSFKINDYQIKFPIGHWAYFGESKITYVISGNNIGKNNLSAEFFKDAEELNISSAISNCDTVKKEVYRRDNMKGNIYLCMRKTEETMYFQSDDKQILIRETDYNSSNEKIIEEYELLFNSISKIKNIKGV